jgi:hypothetical protein
VIEKCKAIGRLAARFITKSLQIQTLVALLFVCSAVILFVYGAYIERERKVLDASIKSVLPDNVAIVRVSTPLTEPLTGVTGRTVRGSPVPTQFAHRYIWSTGQLMTDKGCLPFALFAAEASPVAEAGQVSVPRDLAAELGISPGDMLWVPELGELMVTDLHEAAEYGSRLLTLAPQDTAFTHFLYVLPAGQMIWKANLVNTLNNIYRRHGGVVIHSESEHGLSPLIMAGTFTPGTRARLEYAAFITVAFVSLRMYVYLDRRKAYAIIKSLGVRSGSLWSMLGAETLLAPLLGSLAGFLAGRLAIILLGHQELHLEYTPGIFVVACSLLALVAFMGFWLPGRYLSQASVLQLMFERSVPLYTRRVEGIGSRIPGIDHALGQGLVPARLATDEGQFSGYIFASVGRKVKKGEVIARIESWWGLMVTEYLAPATGEVAAFSEQSGVVLIKPD